MWLLLVDVAAGGLSKPASGLVALYAGSEA